MFALRSFLAPPAEASTLLLVHGALFLTSLGMRVLGDVGVLNPAAALAVYLRGKVAGGGARARRFAVLGEVAGGLCGGLLAVYLNLKVGASRGAGSSSFRDVVLAESVATCVLAGIPRWRALSPAPAA